MLSKITVDGADNCYINHSDIYMFFAVANVTYEKQDKIHLLLIP